MWARVHSLIHLYVFWIVLGFALLSSGSVMAQSEFAPGEDFYEEVVLKDLPISTAIAFAPQNRAYLALKIGVVRTIQDEVLLSEPFLDISAMVNKATDRGLLGLAVDPDFPSKPYVYLSYVYDPPGAAPDVGDPRLIQIARVTADAAKDYKVALPGSLEVIVGKNSVLENMAPPVPDGDPNIPERASCMTGLSMDGDPIEDCIPNDYPSHSAGTLMFGHDRVLFASIGDGADYTQPNRVGLRTQNLDSLSGRVLRINPDTGQGISGNPWFDPARPGANRSRVWMYGFRNPFRITINPLNEQVYVGDVGTSYYEEINVGKGLNFGWPCYEGGFTERSQLEGEATASIPQVGYSVEPRTVDFCSAMYAQGQGAVRKPLYTYRHPYDETGKDLGASVTGLAFYFGDSYPATYRGSLFFADYAQNFIKYLTFDGAGRPTAHDFALETGSNLGAVQLTIGPDTNLYATYIDLKTRTSQVRRFRARVGGNSPPVVRAEVSPLFGDVPLVVTADASKSFDSEGQSLSFSWNFGDGSSATGAQTQHVYSKAGNYTVTITVKELSAPYQQSSDSFTVRAGVRAPIAHIISPASGSTYRIGVPVALEGQVDSAGNANVTASWNILQIHNLHTHLVNEINSQRASFMPEEHTDNTSYELCFVVSAGEGLEDQECQRILPQTSAYLFASSPPGASIVYLDEEKEVVAPYQAYPIVGSSQSIIASKLHAGRSFVGWSDGILSRERSFTTKNQPWAFTAVYRNLAPKAVISPALTSRGARAKAQRQYVFDASNSIDPEGEALTYSWRFSDGGRAAGSVAKKRFKADGRYRVRLTVTDALGAASTARTTITVRGKSSRRAR